MKKHIIRTLSVCIALLLLSACRQEQDGLAVADESAASVQVSFTLTTASGNASTRVGTDEPGTGYENYIDITNNNFRFLLFDTEDDTFVYSFTPQSVTPAGASGEYAQTYKVEGEMPEEYADFNYKVVVLANWPDYPDANDLIIDRTTIEDICSAYAYQYTAPFVPSEEQLIPFYGVATINTTLSPDISTNLGSIDLLRALCKVEVKCSADGFTLKEVKLNKYSTKGMCAPLEVYNNTKEDWEKNEQIHLPQDNTVGASLSLSNPDGTFIAYVPEYNNAALKDSYLEVTLTDANNKEVTLKSPNIYFKNYTDGSPVDGSDYDLIRNHWYQFDITKVDDGELKLEYRVLLWDKVESAIGWNPILQKADKSPVAAWRLATAEGYTDTDVENEVKGSLCIDPDFKNAKRGDEEAVFCYVLYPRYNSDKDKQGHALHQGLEDNTSYAGFYFYLKEPEGAIWEAVLTNTEDFALNENGRHDIDGDGEDDKKCAVRGIARSEAYQIQVYPLHPWTDTEFQKDENGNIVDGAECANTYWGNLWETSGKCKNLYTDLYIRISIDGGHTWNYLDINPKDRYGIAYDGVDGYIEHTYWGERRFAGGDDENGGSYIRIWQLEAKYNKAYDKLVEDLDASWGIKDFWDPYDKLSE